MTVITHKPKLSFVTGHLRSATRHARDVEPTSRRTKRSSPILDRSRGIPDSKSRKGGGSFTFRLNDFFIRADPRSSRFLPFLAGYRAGCAHRFYSSSLSPAFRPSTTTTSGNSPPHPRAPYGGVTNDSTVYEYGLFGRDRCGKGLSRANALLSLWTAKKERKRGHKNVRVIFHLHACRNLNLFFLLLLQLRSGFLFLLHARPFGFQDR